MMRHKESCVARVGESACVTCAFFARGKRAGTTVVKKNLGAAPTVVPRRSFHAGAWSNGRALAFAVAASLSLAAAPAFALDIPLNIEFDTGEIGNYATVTVNESGGDLDFVISLAGTVLGPASDIHEFYFNLDGTPTGVTIFDTNAPVTEYELTPDPSVAGGAGSSFEYGVNFGNGAGGPGNGVLQARDLSISADEDLTIDSLNVPSSTYFRDRDQRRSPRAGDRYG